MEACNYLAFAAPGDPDAVEDKKWIDSTTRKNKEELHRLENELKSYKNSLIKESIRVRGRAPAVMVETGLSKPMS